MFYKKKIFIKENLWISMPLLSSSLFTMWFKSQRKISRTQNFQSLFGLASFLGQSYLSSITLKQVCIQYTNRHNEVPQTHTSVMSLFS